MFAVMFNELMQIFLNSFCLSLIYLQEQKKNVWLDQSGLTKSFEFCVICIATPCPVFWNRGTPPLLLRSESHVSL